MSLLLRAVDTYYLASVILKRGTQELRRRHLHIIFLIWPTTSASANHRILRESVNTSLMFIFSGTSRRSALFPRIHIFSYSEKRAKSRRKGEGTFSFVTGHAISATDK